MSTPEQGVLRDPQQGAGAVRTGDGPETGAGAARVYGIDIRQRRDARETPSLPPRKKPRSRRAPRPAPGPPPAPTATEAV